MEPNITFPTGMHATCCKPYQGKSDENIKKEVLASIRERIENVTILFAERVKLQKGWGDSDKAVFQVIVEKGGVQEELHAFYGGFHGTKEIPPRTTEIWEDLFVPEEELNENYPYLWMQDGRYSKLRCLILEEKETSCPKAALETARLQVKSKDEPTKICEVKLKAFLYIESWVGKIPKSAKEKPVELSGYRLDFGDEQVFVKKNKDFWQKHFHVPPTEEKMEGCWRAEEEYGDPEIIKNKGIELVKELLGNSPHGPIEVDSCISANYPSLNLGRSPAEAIDNGYRLTLKCDGQYYAYDISTDGKTAYRLCNLGNVREGAPTIVF